MKKNIAFGKSVYTIEFAEFEDEIDVDDLMTIHYENLIGEVLTFPVIVNRLGLLLADAERALSEQKLTFDIFEAKLKEEKRAWLAENNDKKPTVDEVNAAVVGDPKYRAQRLLLFNAQKNRDYVASLLFSAKDKSAKLDKLSLSIAPGDAEEYIMQRKADRLTSVKKRKPLIE